MAKLYKCDRCGAVYTDDTLTSLLGIYKMSAGFTPIGDFCIDCIHDIRDFAKRSPEDERASVHSSEPKRG